MKRGRVLKRVSTRRGLRRKNIVVDDDDEDDAESMSQEEVEDEDEEKKDTPPPKLTRSQAKKQEEAKKKKKNHYKNQAKDDEEYADNVEDEEDEEDREEEKEEDEREADLPERRRGSRGRGSLKKSTQQSKPPPRKKPRRKIVESDDEVVADEEDVEESEEEEEKEDEAEEEEKEEEAEMDEEEDVEDDGEEEAEEVKPRRRNTLTKGISKTMTRGKTRAKTAAIDIKPLSEKKLKSKEDGLNNADYSGESEENENDEDYDDTTTNVMKDVKQLSDLPSATVAISSTKKHKRLSIDTLMNAENNKDVFEEQIDDMTPSDAGTDADELPDQYLREAFSEATTDLKLMEILTESCGRLIREKKAPSRLFCVALLGAVKENSARFCQPVVFKYLLRLLRSKHYLGMKDVVDYGKKTNSAIALGLTTSTEFSQIPLPVLVTNVLMLILEAKSDWPKDSVKVFLDDSLFSRVWVDHEYSQLFVQNVKTVLEMDEIKSTQPFVRRRFQGINLVQELKDLIIGFISSRLVELNKEKSSSSGPSTGTGGNHALRNMIMTLADFASIPQIRVLGAENMEVWLQNPSVKGPARELLHKIVASCQSTSSQDIATVDLLLKLKLKSTMFQLKVEAITHLVCKNLVYLRRALSMFIARERPNNMSRDVDNIKMLQHIFRASRSLSASSILGSPEDIFYRRPIEHQGTLASRELARVFREMASTSDVSPVLKTIVRKVLKQLTFEQVDIKALCVGFLGNEGHWDAMTGDARVLDYMGLITGVVWLILLMRGAAVKSLQIQHSSAVNRQSSASSLPSGLKHGGAIVVSRRGANPPLSLSRINRLAPLKGKQSSGKHPLSSVTGVSGSPAPVSQSITGNNSGNNSSAATEGSRIAKISVWAKEELQQALAFVQREAIICCRDVLEHFGLSGDSPFEKKLYENIVKKLLFLEMPSDVQLTEHDRTCFQTTKENIPIHEDSLNLLTDLFSSCPAIDRMEALRTMESVVFRGADAHLHREALWRYHEDDLASYAQHGGVLGLTVKNSAIVQQLFKLSLWQKKSGDQQDQEFCHSSRFWICCSILVVVGCFNPNTIGTYLWENVPTLRSFMQMAITGRYTFPATSSLDPLLLGKHRSAFSDVLQGNAHLRDYEQQVMKLNQNDTAVIEDPLMLFESNGLARQPPPAILEHVCTLDRKFKLGMRLRQSRKKDFLMEMVTGNEDANAIQNVNVRLDSAWWIADIVCEDFDTMQYLPYRCLCQLLLLAVRPDNKVNSDSLDQRPHRPALAHIIPHLIGKLREYIAAGNDDSEAAQNVILYYLECLSSTELCTRRVAAHILNLLTATRKDQELSDKTHKVMISYSAKRTQSFSWLLELAKLPCYSSIRSKIFNSLETLLELESSIASLQMCMKALHDFSKEDEKAAITTSESFDFQQDHSCQPKKCAIEKALILAGTYGKLLAGRDLVATLLLKVYDIFAMAVEVIWRAIESQLEIAPHLKATSGISFSDCKVIYVTDGANTIREIKLPLAIIHGAIQVLSSPHAHKALPLSASRVGSRDSTCLARLTESLFPKATPNAAIFSSTGLIATKDPRLYPDHLLAKLAAAASSSTSYLCATAIRAMSMKSRWNLLEQSALSEQCLEMALLSIIETTQKNESKATASLLAATKTSDISMAADTMLMQLSAYNASPVSICASDTLKELSEWLQKWTGSSKLMKTDEEEKEKLLLAEGFSFFKIDDSRNLFTSKLNYAEPTAVFNKIAKLKRKGGLQSDLTILQDAYSGFPVFLHIRDNEFATFDRSSLIQGIKHEENQFFTAVALPDTIIAEDSLYAASRDEVRSCSNNYDSSWCSTATMWTLHMSLLHFAGVSCKYNAAAAQLAETFLVLVNHLPTCACEEHRKNCSSFVRRALDNLGECISGSYSASISFIQHLAQASMSEGFYVLNNATIAIDVRIVLNQLVQFIDRTIAQWKYRGVLLRFDAMTLHSLVLLVKEVEVLWRLENLEKFETCCAADLLTRIAHDQFDDKTMINILDPIMSADLHLGSLGDVVVIHEDVKRELITALYFQKPKLVAGLLDILDPDWEVLVNFDLRADLRHKLVIQDDRVLSQVDDILRDLTHGGCEVVEQFRGLTRRHPMLVLSRFPRQLTRHIGTVSLSQLYLNTTFFQNILNAMQIMQPHLRHQQTVLEPFCYFLFEILRVIADHHAVEFHHFVSHIWEFFYDVVEADVGVAYELIFLSPRVVVMENIVNMYDSQPATVAFGKVLGQRHNEQGLLEIVKSIRNGRNMHHTAASQQQHIEQLLTQIECEALPLGKVGKLLIERKDINAVVLGLQAIDSLCAKTDQGTSAVALLRRCAAPLASLLLADTVSKAVMLTLCQTLLNLMKFDSICVDYVMRQYVQCLRILRPGLKEAAVNTVLDFLIFADTRQRRQILQQLFDDPSEIAKTKLGAYLKSSAFRKTHLIASKA